MRSFELISSLRAYVRAARDDGKTIGFVPTMGALHEGHVALMQRARGECDVVVVSIFVNPTQFGPTEDFSRYPRDLNRDSRVAQSAGVDALFTPSVDEIYPDGDQTYVEAPKVAALWEGEARPGHFRGVATVCAKLFHVVQPDRAYFGRKDYQQLKVIERLVADLCMPLSIVPVQTVREPDGLAMSSRNAYLSPEDRVRAGAIYRGLMAAQGVFSAGERDTGILAGAIRRVIDEEPCLSLEYGVVVDSESLEPVDRLKDTGVALVAARIGGTRLIDSQVLV